MGNEVNTYGKLLTNPYNPVYFTLALFLGLVLVIYLLYLKIFLPLQKKHEKEKRKIELENLRIIGAFSESDPNPVIRTDLIGNIIHFNTSAKNIFNLVADEKPNISKILPDQNYDLKKEIMAGSHFQSVLTWRDRNFSVYFYGMRSLNMARIYFIDNTDKLNNENRVIESEKKYRALSFYLQDHLEEEKERIGLELHDSIGQNLHFIKMKLNRCESYSTFNDTFPDIKSALDTTISELREILFNLKPTVLEDLGLLDAVKQYSEHMSKNFSIKGTIEYFGTPARLEKKAEMYLFRIIQEAIGNILRHSRTEEYSVQFVYSKKHLKIVITDNGIGFNPDEVDRYHHYGLLNMAERMNILKGRMNINSSEQDGTSLVFELPL